jgi:hypothetical protein
MKRRRWIGGGLSARLGAAALILGLAAIPFNPLVEPIAECQAGVCKISA